MPSKSKSSKKRANKASKKNSNKAAPAAPSSSEAPVGASLPGAEMEVNTPKTSNEEYILETSEESLSMSLYPAGFRASSAQRVASPETPSSERTIEILGDAQSMNLTPTESQELYNDAFDDEIPLLTQEVVQKLINLRCKPPSTLGLDDMRSIKVREMEDGVRYEGRRLPGLVIVPIDEDSRTLAGQLIGFIDEDDVYARLHIRFPPTNVQLKFFLPAGTLFTVREPVLVKHGEARIVVVCHPSDLVEHHTGGIKVDTFQGWLGVGEKCADERNFTKAVACYNQALAVYNRREARVSFSLMSKLYYQRSKAYKGLGLWEAAATDGALSQLRNAYRQLEEFLAIKGNKREDFKDPKFNPLSEAVRAEACYHLERYEHAHGVANRILDTYPTLETDMPETWRFLVETASEAAARIGEAAKASYSHLDLPDDRSSDVATFRRNVATGPALANEGERGLFATRALVKGEVVMIEKAFAVVKGGDEPLDDEIRDSRLIQLLVRMVLRELESLGTEWRERFFHLPGGNAAYKDVEVDGVAVLDADFVGLIVQRCRVRCGPSHNNERDAAIYLLAAHMRHSDMPNCSVLIRGNAVFVGALRDIAAHEELTADVS